MDWELYEQYRATLVLVVVGFLSFLLLAFQRSSPVQHLKSAIAFCTLPSQRLLSHWAAPSGSTESRPALASSATESAEAVSVLPAEHAEASRAVQMLTAENKRLHQLLDLKQDRWPGANAAHIIGRDPQRWFQEIVLDKGKDDGLKVDDPVVAIIGEHEGLVGRIIEVDPHVAKAMLLQDSLSAVASAISGEMGEDGVVEGTNSHDLYMRYLSRDSHTKIGDLVVTSGLGGVFPEGIPIGWVQDVSLDGSQLFLQARLRPAVLSHPLRVVAVLTKKDE